MTLEMDFDSKEGHVRASGMINDIRIAYLFDPSKHDIDQVSQGVFNPEKDDFVFTYDNDEAVNWLDSQ